MVNYNTLANITNITAYQFVTINNILTLKEKLLAKCNKLQLKGTILLANEGINLMLAGQPANIETFKTTLITLLPQLKSMPFKESVSIDIPYQRMKVKIKASLIPLRDAKVDPENQPAPYISPKKAKQLLETNGNFILLDVRNHYEIEHGTFAQAIHLNIAEFDEFTAASQKQLKNIDKATPIVTFCTGGIRCEKAAPYLIQQGFQNVYQIEGGILNYFKECSGEHYQGQCFVFDDRGAVAPDLGYT